MIYFVENTDAYQVPSELQYAFEGRAASFCRVLGDGPSGTPGLLLGVSSRGLRFEKESQSWMRLPGTKIWAAASEDDAPANLVREQSLRGHEIELGDGRTWVVPVARAVDETSSELIWQMELPRTIVLNEQGEWAFGPVVERCRRLWEIATWWFDEALSARLRDQDVKIDPQQVYHRATEVLGYNYRIGPVECSLLGLWQTGLADLVLDALCDMPTLNRWAEQRLLEKKRDEIASGS